MSYTATAVNVMMASPGDVSRERRLARDVIEEWNAIHAQDRRVVLMPVGWETHSSPEMGDRAQAIINRQVLSNCDLLIAVFWTRLGTPTGAAPSGTVEEIAEHLAAGKQAMIYFSSAPVRLDSADNAQYTALLAFRESCRQRGLVEGYDDLTQFREKLARQLAQTVIRQFTSVDVSAADAQSSPQAEPPAISSAAQELLVEASQDNNGVVMRIGHLGGTNVMTNGRNFVEGSDARSIARWRGAVDELQRNGFIEDRGGKGEVFSVTDEGYRVADLLRERTPA